MPPLRILHVGKFYPPVSGGMETVLERLCEAERPAIETRALVMSRARQTIHDTRNGVPVTRVGSVTTIGAVTVAPTLPIWLRRADADVIVLHEPNPVALVAYCLARPRGRLIVWYHSEVIRPVWRYRIFYEPFLEFALRRAARIVVSSPPMRDVRALVRHRPKCVIIPYGLDLTRYRASPEVAAKVENIRRASPSPVVLFVGRMVRYKGIEVLLRAVQGLDVQTVLVGEGPLRSSLEVLARDLGIAARVHFAGEVAHEDLVAWYHACHLFVLPSISRQEAFGVVQIEAMACARPVVSTALATGVPWVNQHERTGLVVPPGDVAALTAAIRRLIEDGGLRQRLGLAARVYAEDRFSAERMVGAVRALYDELLPAPAAWPVEPVPSKLSDVGGPV